jgi:RNA polymerase sigma-70 factor, ECF subfamily
MPSGAVGNSSGTWHLRPAAEGPPDGWEALVREHRERLRRMVSLRLDGRLRGRVDPSDVVRQVCAEARGRHPDYLRGPTEPFFLWLRRLAAEKLQSLRQQLGGAAGDGGRELCLRRGPLPAANSQALAAQLLGQAPPPDRADARARRQARLEEALNAMAAEQREVLALRHFERLTAAEAAAVLELPEAEAGRLYLRALKALKVVFEDTPGPTRREGP